MIKKIRQFILEIISRSSKPQPINSSTVMIGLSLIVVILAITAGFFHQVWVQEQKKYASLEDRYVRVRNKLGRESMQELIDSSYFDDSDKRNEVE